MAGKLFGMASFVSVILLSFTLLLWLAAFLPAAGDYSLSVTNDFHIGIWSGFQVTPQNSVLIHHGPCIQTQNSSELYFKLKAY
ncbi:MAG: hypothetical protein JXM70_05485 [Pirellulales bacterium]|nr:hypothetical protein [Pirellulales bacterium]